MNHRASPRFWKAYRELPARHPSLHFKVVGRFWSVRVGLHHRALAVEGGPDLIWFWIGSHADYDALIARS